MACAATTRRGRPFHASCDSFGCRELSPAPTKIRRVLRVLANLAVMSRSLVDAPPHPLRIFVVENHADTLKWLSIYLELMGHTVLTAMTKAAALAALPDADCDMLISDIGLPDGDGWELLKSARLKRPIYAVAMSGFGLDGDRRKSKAVGYRHHLVKPFVPEELDIALELAAREAASRVRTWS